MAAKLKYEVEQKKAKEKLDKKQKKEAEYDELKKIYFCLFTGSVYAYLNFVKNPFNQWEIEFNYNYLKIMSIYNIIFALVFISFVSA